MKTRTRNILLGLTLALGVIAFSIATYNYFKPHENIRKASPDYRVEATQLLKAFETDEISANDQYLGKIIEVAGTVASAATDENGLTTVTLASDNPFGGVICEMDALSQHSRKEFNPGESITMKGKCTGYLMDVVLVRCVEIQ